MRMEYSSSCMVAPLWRPLSGVMQSAAMWLPGCIRQSVQPAEVQMSKLRCFCHCLAACPMMRRISQPLAGASAVVSLPVRALPNKTFPQLLLLLLLCVLPALHPAPAGCPRSHDPHGIWRS